MSVRRLLSWSLFLLAASAANAGETFDVDTAVRQALSNDPDVITAQAEVSEAEARQQQAGLLFQDNPQVEGGAGPRKGERTSTDYSVELSQQIEIGGQRTARIEAANASLNASRARLAWRRVETAASVRQSFGRVLAAQRLVAVARDSENTAQQALDAADKRFRAGDISRLEINAARIEHGRSAQDRSRAEQRAAVALAELHLMLALPPEETLVVRGDLPNPSTVPLGELPTSIAKALEVRGDLQMAHADVETARAESRLAASEWLPKPRVGASFAHEEGDDIVQGLIGVDLPAFNRNQAGRGTAAARVVQTEQVWQAVRRRAEQEIRLAHFRVRAAEQAASAYAADVVSAMRENLDLSNRAYQASQLDFTQLLLIRRESIEAHRGYVDALEELNAARADLNRALGRE